jgi:5-methylcytosine-specific restriction endonuclease McrA
MSQAKRLPLGESAFNSILSQYTFQAKIRQLNFSLTAREFRDLVTSDCAYCGQPPIQVKKLSGGSFVYNGIDRLDNTQDYTSTNTVPACIQCNRAKHKQTFSDFRAWVLRVAEFEGPATFKPDTLIPNAAARHLLNRYIQSCRHKNISFELPEATFFGLVQQSCAYCGKPPARTVNYSGKSFIYNGIDRKDCAAGYTVENCVPACFDCNNAKGTQTVDEFKTWAKRVAENVARTCPKPSTNLNFLA